MKSIGLLLVTLTLVSTAKAACLDVSGCWESPVSTAKTKSLRNLTQESCGSLSDKSGVIREVGEAFKTLPGKRDTYLIANGEWREAGSFIGMSYYARTRLTEAGWITENSVGLTTKPTPETAVERSVTTAPAISTGKVCGKDVPAGTKVLVTMDSRNQCSYMIATDKRFCLALGSSESSDGIPKPTLSCRGFSAIDKRQERPSFNYLLQINESAYGDDATAAVYAKYSDGTQLIEPIRGLGLSTSFSNDDDLEIRLGQASGDIVGLSGSIQVKEVGGKLVGSAPVDSGIVGMNLTTQYPVFNSRRFTCELN
jgi:hypothetical protein